ncbi:hypothetical protein TrRE_jg2332 [Triparma retinervis]|uniref:IQ motif and ubiquitin-like domain-containing protein n=1 Tax=Triparma retinervis TaxID=2557542 RepID=A0A9W6ZBZ9_9STRA|nr:hypothetical protein TrRE_jg2332 [Triparma retinervis]
MSSSPEVPSSLPPIDSAYPPYVDPNYIMPGEITVSTMLDDGRRSTFNVTIEKLPEDSKKSYLGGYRHKRTGVTYHHGSAQTQATARVHKDVSNLRNRDTQTYSMVTKSTQLVRESGTQMKRKDVHLDDAGDKEVEAKPYFTSNQLLELQRNKTLVIQCYWRGYIARKQAWDRRDEIYQRQLSRLRAAEDAVRDRAALQKEEIERRMNPRTVSDFEILYNELESWRHAEMAKVKGSGLGAGPQKAMVAALLAKETKLLQTIDRLKAKAVRGGRDKRVDTMMRAMSKSKKWELSSGMPVKVETPFTTRAKELSSLFLALKGEVRGADERLDVLLNVKWTVNEFDCALTRDIVELIDREADLLNRGRSQKTLKGLRQRLTNLFLQFVETPEFNPEAQRFLKVGDGFEAEPIYKTLAAPSNWA